MRYALRDVHKNTSNEYRLCWLLAAGCIQSRPWLHLLGHIDRCAQTMVMCLRATLRFHSLRFLISVVWVAVHGRLCAPFLFSKHSWLCWCSMFVDGGCETVTVAAASAIFLFHVAFLCALCMCKAQTELKRTAALQHVITTVTWLPTLPFWCHVKYFWFRQIHDYTFAQFSDLAEETATTATTTTELNAVVAVVVIDAHSFVCLFAGLMVCLCALCAYVLTWTAIDQCEWLSFI